MRGLTAMTALCMVAAASSTVWAQASAQDGRSLHKQVHSGHRVRIYGYIQIDSKCRFNNPPTIQIVTPPAHGTVTTRLGDVIARDPPRNSLNDCRGHSGPGITIYYRPDKDYVGPDSFTWTTSYTNASVAHDSASVDVLPPQPSTAAPAEDESSQ